MTILTDQETKDVIEALEYFVDMVDPEIEVSERCSALWCKLTSQYDN